MEVDIARCQKRIQDPVAKRLWRKEYTVKSSNIDIWQGSKYASGLCMFEKTHFHKILKYNKQAEGWYLINIEEITFNLWRNQTDKYLKTPTISINSSSSILFPRAFSPHTLSLYSFLRFSYELLLPVALFPKAINLSCQTFCFLCNVFHYTHQGRCYNFFIIEVAVESVNLTQMSK